MRGLGLRPVDIIFQSYINPGEGGYPHHAKRREFVDNIKKDFSDCLIDIGYDKNKEPDSNYPLPYSRHEHFTDYFRALSRAKIGLCLHGAGEDCARTWEVAASGAVPAIQRYTIKHVEPWWRDGVNCIEFDTYEEFREKVAGYLTEPHYPRLLRIQQHAWAFGRTYHRTQHRAQYILDTIGVKNEHV
jgi:hypothetical protein